MSIAVFIDYDNLLTAHKTSGILDVVTKVLLQVPPASQEGRRECAVRIYGGWYEGPSMTQLAQKVAVEIQRDFPAIIRLPKGTIHSFLPTTAELAVAMMEEPSHHLFGTYRRKGKPANLRVQMPQSVGCTDAACPLPLAAKLLKSGSCPISTCTVSAWDLVYRHEQKLVDTMLTCDIIYALRLDYEQIILVSDDDDFLPPLRTASLRGTRVARFHPRPSAQRSPLSSLGRQIIDINL